MEIIHEWEENRDGILYECKAYEDGHIEENLKEGYENAISNTQMANIEMQTNVEYLVALAEMEA